MLWNNCNVGRGNGGPQELIITWQCKVTIQNHLHFIFKLNQKRIFAQDIYHFHCHIRSWFLKGGVPIFYDFCNNALEPLPPIIGLVLYIFLQLTSICMKRILRLVPIKKSLYNIFLDCWTFSDYSNRWLWKNDNFQSHLRCLRWTSDNPNHMNNMFWESRNDSEWSADETPNMTTVINFTFFGTPP